MIGPEDLLPGTAAEGFGAALVIPAAVSTLKQAQREAAAELHVLADYHRAGRAAGALPAPSPAELRAAQEVGRVISREMVNGAAFFLAVKAVVALGGPAAGMLAQLGITLNSMLSPQQTQQVNPARALFELIERQPDWVGRLPEVQRRQFMDYVGRFAVGCGYGGLGVASRPPVDLETARWDEILDAAPSSVSLRLLR